MFSRRVHAVVMMSMNDNSLHHRNHCTGRSGRRGRSGAAAPPARAWPSIRSAAAPCSTSASSQRGRASPFRSANLNRVIDYPAADLTITVEAGMTLAELAKCLAAQRQRLPVDVPQPDRATVGGAVAVNAAGPRRYAYGTMRDYVLGFTAVDGAGTIFSRRRPRGQKRRRLQYVPLDGRLVRHAGHHDAGDADGPAAARGIRVSGVRAARFQSCGETAGRSGHLAGAARGH